MYKLWINFLRPCIPFSP